MEIMKAKREEKRLTQEQLAEAVGVDRSTITKIENGGRPSVKTAQKIAEVLEFDWTEFYSDYQKNSA
ncbi:MAG: helix-turn-helix domain-containing protein [Clostridia bacterium]|nr:helix-turn-helix domain-containing protein [Clostridia bacterium]